MSKKRTKDPRVLANGRCYQCGRERTVVALKHDDPFCRTECCRTYYAGEPRKLYEPKKSKQEVAA